MKKTVRTIFNSKFFRFVIIGCINTMTYFMIYLFLLHVASIPYFIAHVLGFFLSMIGSYFLNCHFTFRVKPSLGKFLRFPLTYVTNFLMSSFGVFLFIEGFHMSKSIAPIAAAAFAIPFTFITSKFILEK